MYINCKNCNKSLPKTAEVCPSCGTMIKAKPGITLKGTIKFTFIVFNIFMIAWMAAYWFRVGDLMSTAQSDIEQAGANIGAMLGTFLISMLWLIGDLILGVGLYVTTKKS